MAVLPIVQVPDPVLRKKALPVERVTKRVQKLIRDMADTMYAANGAGLAAPQVGVSERVIVVDAGDGLVALINPRIIAAEGSEVDVEGCLSIPNVSVYVERAAKVEVEGWDERGRTVRIKADGLLARALQHEIDHLDGILITDKGSPIQRADEEAASGSQASTPGEKST
ncbi:MAG: peptide deformylase [Firmicutes bacterium ZCTH02-B6]|nr:MAG: peptide deformylase [Firmicutes bacterium ZCTH02-B6]